MLYYNGETNYCSSIFIIDMCLLLKYLKMKTKNREVISDGFGNEYPACCPSCGRRAMYINRPGDGRCKYCYDDTNNIN